MIWRATSMDVDQAVELERRFFADDAHKPEGRPGYEFVINYGTVDFTYRNGQPAGMLALVPVNAMYGHENVMRALPDESPLRQRFRRGYFDERRDRQFVHAFVSDTFSPDLTRLFRAQPHMVGYVPEDDTRSLEFYDRVGCTIDGTVENIHIQGKRDIVFLYDRD